MIFQTFRRLCFQHFYPEILNSKSRKMRKIYKTSFVAYSICFMLCMLGAQMSFAQCNFTNCPTTNIVEELGSGECSVTLLINVPITDMGCGVTLDRGDGNGPQAFSSSEISFQVGATTLLFATPDDVCSYDVVVNPFPNPTTSIACNDLVQISLGDDCIAIIGADQLLEGGNYNCFDDYTVNVLAANGALLGNTVDNSYIGQTVDVQVTDVNNNSCWGKITIEDKLAPPLDCQDVFTRCNLSTEPGAAAPAGYTAEFSPAEAIGDGAFTTVDLDVTEAGGLTIADLNVVLNISHTNIEDLRITLRYGTLPAMELVDFTATGCTGDDITITFDSDASNNYAALLATCNASSPAVNGIFQPSISLAGLNGLPANQIYTLGIQDVSGNGEVGVVNSVSLDFSAANQTVSFPGDNVTVLSQDNNVYTVSGLDACGNAILSYIDNPMEQACSTPYTEIIERIWTAIDEQGNTSQPCTQTIYVYRNDLSTLTWPRDYDGQPGNLAALNCRFYGGGAPGTNVTGVPSGDFCDKIQIFPPEDTRIDICEMSFKIIRHWKILDWCSGEVLEHDQIIKVEDAEGPVVEQPVDMTMSAEAYNCGSDAIITMPVVTRECSSNITFQVGVAEATAGATVLDQNATYFDTGSTGNASSPITVSGLGFGNTWISITLLDDCGNTTTVYKTITIVDNIPPVAVCQQFTVTSLGATGTAKIEAASFDDISNDNCGIVLMEVAKMVDICSNNTSFGPDVSFCCAEVNTSVMVQFRVTDAAGNSNTCMVEVKVQDKLAPFITECPDDITLDCQSLEIENLDITGRPVAVDNCSIESVDYTDSGSLDQCGRGTITRTWTVLDPEGLKASCVQTITVEDSDPFNSGDINWPSDYEAVSSLNNCVANLDPSELPAPFNGPAVNDDVCSLVAITHKDQVFSFSDGACLKILREWTVIDWCTYDQNATTPTGIYTYLQVIKVNNFTAPTFEEPCVDVTVSVFEDGCTGVVNQEIFATDDCTDVNDLVYTWKIDAFDTGDNVYEFSGSGNSFDLNLPYGTHGVVFEAEDHCGNIGVCSYRLTVRDGKKPTPYCLSSVTSVVMNGSGSLSIWADDFDFGSSDNCTDEDDLIIAFNEAGTITSVTFTCADILDGVAQYIPLQMWVIDEAGNKEFCEIGIVLQDNSADMCMDQATGTAYIRGNVMTSEDDMVSGVDINMTSSSSAIPQSIETNITGQFTFTNLPYYQNYFISAEKDIDYINGVSTLDLVLIQKHILGITPFDSPYKTIAADIDNNANISAIDLITLRKLILGVIDDLPNNQESWRFVDQDYQFGSNIDVFPYDEIIDFVSLDNNQEGMNFTAVKIGDINGSADATYLNGNTAENKSNNTLNLLIDDQSTEVNELIEVPVYAANATNKLGFQFTMNFDAEALNFKGIKAGSLTISEDNLGLSNLSKGLISASWFDIDGVAINKDDVLFTLQFESNSETNLADALYLSDKLTQSESYDVDYSVADIKLSYNTANGYQANTGMRMEQNTPNPFSGNTQIEIYSPELVDAQFTVYEATGKVIYNTKLNLNEGINTISLGKNEIATTGILYYTLESGDYKEVRKMAVMK